MALEVSRLSMVQEGAAAARVDRLSGAAHRAKQQSTDVS
jgi:hypothetical protein